MKKTVFIALMATLAFTQANAAQEKRPDPAQLCQGKAVNAKVSTKMGDRQMEGTCQIGFKATNPNTLERGAMRDPAVQNACKGKAKGTAVVAKVDGKSVPGKCELISKGNGRR